MLIVILSSLSSSRSRLRNRQVRNRNRRDECHETWTDYEIHHPCCHGWYYCYLRTCRRCPHCWSSWRTVKIFIVQVSSDFYEFFTTSNESCDRWKKINDHNPLHSHLLLQPINIVIFVGKVLMQVVASTISCFWVRKVDKFGGKVMI